MTTITLTPELKAAAEEIMAAAQQAETSAPLDGKYTVTGELIELPASVTRPLLKEFKAAEKEYQAAKQRFEDAKTAIATAMDYHEVLVAEETGQMLVEHRVTTGMVLDTAKLKKEKPEIASAYQRERRSRTLRVLV